MFESAKSKLERADEHLRDFERRVDEFVNAHPHRPIIKSDCDGRDEWRTWVEIKIAADLPATLSPVLGDAIHNYRCVLDHLVWELIGVDGGTLDRHTKLPSGRRREDFEASARGMITPRQDTKDFFVDLAIYPSGSGEALYALNALDNMDKHTVIVPVIHVTYVDRIRLINLATNARVDADPVYAKAVGQSSFVFEAPVGFGIDVDHRFYPTPDVFFPEIDVFPNEPVIPTMANIATNVEQAVWDFEEFLASRTP